MWRGRLLLHKQGLGQLALVLLDLLLHVIDCTCNLARKRINKCSMEQKDTAFLVPFSTGK